MIGLFFIFLSFFTPFIIEASQEQPKHAIVVGASVGMGRELCKMLAADGYIVGMASRRIGLLQELQQEIPTETHVMYMDISQPEDAVEKLIQLINTIGGLDLLVIAPTGFWDCDFDSPDWKDSLPVLMVDCVGFFALARTGLALFEEQGYGHLVGFSSVDGLINLRNNTDQCPAYSAAKAFCSRYLRAENNKYAEKNIPIYITDICPGFINSTPRRRPSAYWVEPLENAMRDIWYAIKSKKRIAYITQQWEKVIYDQLPQAICLTN